MSDQRGKYETFKALHQTSGAFVVANPWDAGTARLFEAAGFAALATTSAGFAFSTGRLDSAAGLGRPEILRNAAQIVAATHLPVSADLEDGFGAAPEICAETIIMAAETGLVGGSIEDATGIARAPIHEFDLAVERVRAAAEAAIGRPFLLTARAEGFLWGQQDLDEIIRRLAAFSEAGADVLYAPGLPDIEAIRTVCQALDKPVNVVMGLRPPYYTVAELAEAGVRRISVGGSFARSAYGALRRAAREVLDDGRFDYAKAAMPGDEIAALMSALPLPDRR